MSDARNIFPYTNMVAQTGVKARLFLLGLAALSWGAVSQADPLIYNAAFDFSQNRVTIRGINFPWRTSQRLPTVVINNARLAVQSCTATSIVATLPANMATGSYTLMVKDGSNQHNENNLATRMSLDVTIGATG